LARAQAGAAGRPWHKEKGRDLFRCLGVRAPRHLGGQVFRQLRTGLPRLPTHTARTRSNHFFVSIYAFFKLELLKLKQQMNPFALRGKLDIKAPQTSFPRSSGLVRNIRQARITRYLPG
jgi:hypothetical protein